VAPGEVAVAPSGAVRVVLVEEVVHAVVVHRPCPCNATENNGQFPPFQTFVLVFFLSVYILYHGRLNLCNLHY
jgi:hypothetical protein